MLFFRRALAQVRHLGVAGALVAVDTRDEHHKQGGVQDETDQQALHVQAGKAPLGVDRQNQGAGQQGQAGQAQARNGYHDPRRPHFQQHGAEDDLQQVQEGKRVADAAAQVELRRQHGDVDQQGEEQRRVGDGLAFVPAQQAGQIEGDEAGQHFEHVGHGQGDAQSHAHAEDGADLADHSQPAQLDQQLHVLVAGRMFHLGRHRTALQHFAVGQDFNPARHGHSLACRRRGAHGGACLRARSTT
ncbi:hypothetical protein D3C72_1295670 [compost metagenome]